MNITRKELIQIHDGLTGIQVDFLKTADVLDNIASTMRDYEQKLADITDLMDDDVREQNQVKHEAIKEETKRTAGIVRTFYNIDKSCITAKIRCTCGRLISGSMEDVSEYLFCPWCGKRLRYKRENGVKNETN